MTDREQIRRDAEKKLAAGHHTRCNSRRGGECDCYMTRSDYCLAADYLAVLAELEQAKWERDEALVAFYHVDPVACANLCDGVLDKRGALLGRIRELAKR